MTLQELDECLLIVEETLTESQGKAEYALYAKALIQRQRGEGLTPAYLIAHQHRICTPAAWFRQNLRILDPISASCCAEPQQCHLSKAGKHDYCMLITCCSVRHCKAMCRLPGHYFCWGDMQLLSMSMTRPPRWPLKTGTCGTTEGHAAWLPRTVTGVQRIFSLALQRCQVPAEDTPVCPMQGDSIPAESQSA